MKSFSAANLIWATENMSRIEMQVRLLGKTLQEKPSDKLSAEFLASIRKSALSLEEIIGDSNAPVTGIAIKRLRKKLDADPCGVTYKALGEAYIQILSRLADEVSIGQILALDADEAALYAAEEPLFGEHVSSAFPDSQADIDEAGKCLATGRYTAAVFHLMRAMEAGLKVLAGQLGIQNVEKEWGKLLSDISARIEQMPKGDARDAWSASHSHLYHVKQAWRNNTMHPKRTYTEEEADSVFVAVKSFMKHLASLTLIK